MDDKAALYEHVAHSRGASHISCMHTLNTRTPQSHRIEPPTQRQPCESQHTLPQAAARGTTHPYAYRQPHRRVCGYHGEDCNPNLPGHIPAYCTLQPAGVVADCMCATKPHSRPSCCPNQPTGAWQSVQTPRNRTGTYCSLRPAGAAAAAVTEKDCISTTEPHSHPLPKARWLSLQTPHPRTAAYCSLHPAGAAAAAVAENDCISARDDPLLQLDIRWISSLCSSGSWPTLSCASTT